MPPIEASWEFEAIGTSWQIDSALRLSDPTREAVASCIEGFDRTWSRFRADSLVARMATQAGTWVLDADARALLDLYDELYVLTEGAVTPLVGQTLADLGYDADYSLVASASPARVGEWSGVDWAYPMLTLPSPMLLDVGAAGKGCLVDLVAGVLKDQGVTGFTVDASGDLAHRGGAPLRVALEHPSDPTAAIGIVELQPGKALCASATNRRAWADGLHHVLDGRTGRPTGDILATWVVAEACMVADGLATALFFAEPDHLAARFDFEFVRMHADGRVEWSHDLPGEVFV
ncbi:MAG: FAD:protein transferase [Nocardioidaceae bacterium]|nr:FAD:protein transferase [Nocardioidaceae bacterium]